MILASIWQSDWVLKISSAYSDYWYIFNPIAIAIVLTLIPVSWKRQSRTFEDRHKRSLWGAVVLLFLLSSVIVWCTMR